VVADVSAFKTLATDLLAANGQTIQIRRITDGAVGSTPWKPAAPASADESVLSTVFQIKDDKIDGTLTQRGDRLALVSAADLTGAVPGTADFLVIGGVVHKIVNVETISPSGDDVLYKIQVRQ
jgi:hypothetical protein